MSGYLINAEEVNMTIEVFKQMEKDDESTTKTISRLPDDPSFVYDIFIPREYTISPFPLRWPVSKNTRIMVGAIDSPFYDKFREKSEVICFDTFWLFESARELVVDEYVGGNDDLKFLFTTMINRSKFHRRILMKELDDFGLLNDNISRYSFLNPSTNTEIIWHGEKEQKFLPSQEWISDGYNHEQPYFEWNVPIELKQSVFQIIAETGYEEEDGSRTPTFVTEKTWTALLLGIPFVVVGNVGFHKDLYDRFGIEMYDEIIDYEFDSITLTSLRIHTLVRQVHRLKNQNLKELRNKVAKKAKKNQIIVHKLISSGDGIPNIETEMGTSNWDFVVEGGQDRIKKGGFLPQNKMEFLPKSLWYRDTPTKPTKKAGIVKNRNGKKI
jgi:hypothetical protein